MPRRRLAVALLCPPALAADVDGLRRAIGVPEPFHVPPHLTLVPPVNVAEADQGLVRALLRDAAARVPPFELSVGPAATFAPASPTVHLAVGGAGDDVEQLDGLRRHLRSGPLDRPDVWPFVPHVTLAEGWPPERIDGVVAALAGVAARWSVTAVHLLTQHRDPAGTRSWVPVAEEPLGGPAVVGRGGVELVLRGVGMVEEGPAACCGLGSVPPPTAAASPTPWTVVAEPPGEPGTVLGAAVGRLSGEVAHLDALAVDAGHRGMGVGAQLLARWCSDAAAHGARTALAESESDVDGPRARFLLRHGFTAVGGVLIRRC